MEQMGLKNDGASIIIEEDRISNLPDDVTYHILSFMDMKDAVQTSILSRKWKHVWTLMPQLNLNSDSFCRLPTFAMFVFHVLSHRNKLAEVSAVNLNFSGLTAQFLQWVGSDILYYAHVHNIRQLTMTWTSVNQQQLPRWIFRSHTLKHLTLIDKDFSCRNSCTLNLVWDFPALETLNVTSIRLGDGNEKNLNLFSKCVNLKDITLHRCSMEGLEIFNICTPQLSKLTITESFVLPIVLNVVAPQLQTLTASTSVVSSIDAWASSSSFLHLASPGFNALEKVNLTLSNSRLKKERHVPNLLELFRILRNVKFLILDMDIIESLSTCVDRLSHEPCPFDNLKCLKIDMTKLKQSDRIPTIPAQVRNYLLENSPNATFIMDLPQDFYMTAVTILVPQKRSRQQVHSDTVTKLAKLEVKKMQMQDQNIAKLKEKLAAQNLQNEKLMSQIIKYKMAELKGQVESGNPDYDVIRSMGRDIKLAMDLIPWNIRVNVEAEFSSQYETLKCFLLNRINATQWTRIETALGNIRHSERFTSSQSQSVVLEHSAAPRPSPANMSSSSGVLLDGSNMMVHSSRNPHI